MIFWLLGCNTHEPLADWSQDPVALEKQCTQEIIPELAITCWIQLAALNGSQGREHKGIEACSKLQEHSSNVKKNVLETWQAECAFRLGEELATSGDMIAGLRHCAFADKFAQNCITHSVWRKSINLSLNSDVRASHLWKNAEEQLTLAMTQLQPISKDLQADAANQLVGHFGYSVYVGSGIANPEVAHLEDKWGPSFRTGFAVERVRLATQSKQRWTEDEIDQLFDKIKQDWSDNKTISGLTNEHSMQLGRTSPARLSPFEQHLPKIHLYGGGRRLVHEDPSIDLQIALLEALFWYPHTPVKWFTKWLDHTESEVRLTAAKLYCLSNGLRGNTTNILTNEPHMDWHFSTCPLK